MYMSEMQSFKMLRPEEKWSCSSEEAERDPEAQSAMLCFAANLLCYKKILACLDLVFFKYEIWIYHFHGETGGLCGWIQWRLERAEGVNH